MSVIWEQTWRSLKTRKLLTVLIILMLSAGLFLIIGSVGYAEHSVDRVNDFYSVYDPAQYRQRVQFPYSDEFSGKDNPTEEGVERAKGYVRELLTSDRIEFYHFKLSSISAYVPDIPDCCLTGYQYFNAYRDNIKDSVNGFPLSSAQGYEISPSVFEKFKLTVAEGRDFSDFDVTDYKTQIIPLVCGDTWRGFYSLGDRIYAMSPVAYGEYLEYEIVGFLEPGISILPPDAESFEEILCLDNYVLFPYIDVTLQPTPPAADINDKSLPYGERFGLLLYQNRIVSLADGVVISNTTSVGLDELVKKYDLGILAPKRVMVIPDSFRESADAYFNILTLASVLIIVSSAFCLSLNLANKLMSNFKTYAIHQISGGTVRTVRLFMIFEVMTIAVISLVIAFLCAAFFGEGVFTYNSHGVFGVTVSSISPLAAVCAVGLAAAAGFVSLVFPCIKISTLEFDTLLRGRE